MPPTPSSLKSCNNPACADLGVINRESLLKCGRCQTITYCNKDCQRAHWPVHKQFCKVWQETGARDVKKKMSEFLWLVRGLTDYTDDLFKEFIAWKREGQNGCIEFLFETSDELDEAIKVIRGLPVVGEHIFRTMPGAPGHQENPEGIPIRLRKRTAKQRHLFTQAVDKKMALAGSNRETRPNLINLLSMVGSSERMMVICVTMRLGAMLSTNSYDFLFKDLDWRPEDAPIPDRLAIEGPNDTPPIRRKISFDMD
ncbi:hypothetical protein C8R44DRAFT_771444 [Mycena epipterygia]|nr:hypothetical protein C8R44DRAFT_771444 [Mycena epipterygia]